MACKSRARQNLGPLCALVCVCVCICVRRERLLVGRMAMHACVRVHACVSVCLRVRTFDRSTDRTRPNALLPSSFLFLP